MAEQEPKEDRRTVPFGDTLMKLQRGRTYRELSKVLQDLTEAVMATHKPGTLTLTLKLAKSKASGMVEVTDTAGEFGEPGHRGVGVLPNVWLGVSVENQQWADIRIPALLDTPAAVRFLSCEPLLGPVDLPWLADHYPWNYTEHGTECVCAAIIDAQDRCNGNRIDWVIVGGESGPGARPMHPDWARSLRDQCVDAGVPFLFKQWGAWTPTGVPPGDRRHWGYLRPDGGWGSPPNPVVSRVGKKAAGRVLDGRTWDEYPERAA